MVAEAISGCNGIHLGRQGKEPRRTERRSGVLVRRGMAWGAAVAFSFMAATTAAAFHSQHSAARSPALLFAGPVLPFGRARARIGSSRQRSPSAQLVTLSGAGGLPLAIRFDQTKRMAARGGENGGQRLSARRSKSRDRSGADLRDGGEKDEDPRDSEDYTGVSSEFNALCQAQFEVVSSLLNATRCVLYFRHEDPKSTGLEFVPAAVYPEKQRVWVVGEGPGGLPSQGALQLPGFIEASSLLPNYPMMPGGGDGNGRGFLMADGGLSV
ncbi:hypothetical protein T484DRAFT_3032279 [Baffinella frigidus]|nr:hypothetical protein T484DRAFT_3032279 [Cryptophyta sp. CCMP2293]